MESISTTFSVIISFWVSGVFMAVYSLWFPAMKIIGILEPNNICAIALPVMIHILLLDSFRERFLRQFIPAFLGKTDE